MGLDVALDVRIELPLVFVTSCLGLSSRPTARAFCLASPRLVSLPWFAGPMRCLKGASVLEHLLSATAHRYVVVKCSCGLKWNVTLLVWLLKTVQCRSKTIFFKFCRRKDFIEHRVNSVSLALYCILETSQCATNALFVREFAKSCQAVSPNTSLLDRIMMVIKN